MKYAAVRRPRSSSGVSVCWMVLRQTALIESAAPATASQSRPIQRELTKPNAMIATPQTAMEMTTTRPRRPERDSHPLLSAASTAPTPGAA